MEARCHRKLRAGEREDPYLYMALVPLACVSLAVELAASYVMQSIPYRHIIFHVASTAEQNVSIQINYAAVFVRVFHCRPTNNTENNIFVEIYLK